MSYRCDVTAIRKLRGNKVSHANNKTPFFQLPNLQSKRFAIPELGIRLTLRVSRAALRTIDKYGGLANYTMRTPVEKLTPKLLKLRRQLKGRPALKPAAV